MVGSLLYNFLRNLKSPLSITSALKTFVVLYQQLLFHLEIPGSIKIALFIYEFTKLIFNSTITEWAILLLRKETASNSSGFSFSLTNLLIFLMSHLLIYFAGK